LLTKIHKQFYAAKLKKKVDPNLFIGYMEDFLRAQMAEMVSEMTDAQFLMHITNNLTNEYENQVNSVKKRIGHLTNPLDIEELREELILYFEHLNTKDEEEEKALFGRDQFKGQCHQCGKWRHKGADCQGGDKKGAKEGKSGGNKSLHHHDKL
jgi:hypothetical protein